MLFLNNFYYIYNRMEEVLEDTIKDQLESIKNILAHLED